MKKISLWVLILIFTASLAGAQESATQQQLDKLSGQLQDLLDAQAQQSKRIDALEKEISEVRDKVNAPVANDYATRDQLGKITDQINEVDRKRKEDSDMIAAQIEKLVKVTASTPVTTHHSSSTSNTSNPTTSSGPDTSSTPQTGYEYEIKQGDTLGMIVKAYRDQGVKVTKTQIIKANPKMNPDVLIPGKKIFIPDASAKATAAK